MKRIPVQSAAFPTVGARKAAIDSFYLTELGRQAELTSKGIFEAVMRGRVTEDPQDPKVFGYLQNALFAAICINRLLKPGPVSKSYPGMTLNQSRQFAEDRGQRLRDALGVEDDWHIFDVRRVRNAYEHFDERLDAYLAGDAECFSDWYITDQNLLQTPSPNDGQATAVGIRVFYPAGGVLFFESEKLFVFELDVELLELRLKIAERLDELQGEISGRATFGGHQLSSVMSEQLAYQRFLEWQNRRASAREALRRRRE